MWDDFLEFTPIIWNKYELIRVAKNYELIGNIEMANRFYKYALEEDGDYE